VTANAITLSAKPGLGQKALKQVGLQCHCIAAAMEEPQRHAMRCRMTRVEFFVRPPRFMTLNRYAAPRQSMF
jgi:hypothetical protein